MLNAAFPLLSPFIQRIDAETAHHAAVRALEVLPLPPAAPDDPRLATQCFGLDFANPVGIAAGFDKDARVPDALMRMGFGFVEVGGVTLNPQPGNPRPRVFRLVQDGAVINRYGLNSAGADAMAARLGRRARNGILGINLGANKDSADRIADYVALTRQLGPLVEFLTLNVSSPNTPGLRDLQGRAFLDDLLRRVMDVRAAAGITTRILLKIAPDVDEIQLDDLVEVAREHAIDGMIVSNTTIARPASLLDRVNAEQSGGLSGAPLFRASTILLARTAMRVEGQFPLIGVGGISSGEDAVAKLSAGANLVQLYTALIYRGPGLITEIKQAILRAMTRENVATVDGLVGRNIAQWAKAEA